MYKLVDNSGWVISYCYNDYSYINFPLDDLIYFFTHDCIDICDIIRKHTLPHYMIQRTIITGTNDIFFSIDDEDVPFAILCGLKFVEDNETEFETIKYRNFLF